MLSVGNSIFFRPKEKALNADNSRKSFYRAGGDHFTLLNVFNQWMENGYSPNWCYENFIQARSMKRARDIKEQLILLTERVEIDLSNELISKKDDNEMMRIGKSIAAGFFYNAAKLNKDGNYKTIKNMHTVHVLIILIFRFTQAHLYLRRCRNGSYIMNLYSQQRNL